MFRNIEKIANFAIMKTMKKYLCIAFLSLIITIIPTAVHAQTAAWDNVDRLTGNIKKTHFPNLWVSVIDFGAVPDNPERPSGDAINRAILYVSRQGGGRVVIPDGTYYTGPITMKSNVNLQLSDKTVLKFLTDPELYFPAVKTRWEGMDCYNTHPLIYAYGESNIAITGNGTIDAQGSPETWWGRRSIERGIIADNQAQSGSVNQTVLQQGIAEPDPTDPTASQQGTAGLTSDVLKQGIVGPIPATPQQETTANRHGSMLAIPATQQQETTATPQQNPRGSRVRLQEWNENATPIYKRIFGVEDGMRPQMINFHSCSTVLIEGVTLLNSPFWTIHPLLCENVIIRDVTIVNNGPNGDGCDPESCKNVLIEGCTFNTGDDCIAIKSGRNADGRRWNVPSENIVVRKCHMINGHGGVVIGSEISGGFRNLYVENCKMDSPELDRVIRIKTSTARGGIIENIYVRNVEVGQCREAILRINLNYEPDEPAQRGFVPTVRNVFLDNVRCSKSEYAVWIYGLDNPGNVNNVHINNCTFNGVETEGNYIYGTFSDVFFHNTTINGTPAML